MKETERKLFEAIQSILRTGSPLVTVWEDGEIDFTSAERVEVADHWANSAMQRKHLYLAMLELFGEDHAYLRPEPSVIGTVPEESSDGHEVDCTSGFCRGNAHPETCSACGKVLPECRWGADWHGLFCNDCYVDQRRENLAALTQATFEGPLPLGGRGGLLIEDLIDPGAEE